MRYFLSIVGLFVAIFFLQTTFAGGCYMPREDRAGTVITMQAVYMRSMPCMEEGGRVDTASNGEELTVLGRSDGWYKVQRGDNIGWIYKTFIAVDKTYKVDGNTSYDIPQDTDDNKEEPKETAKYDDPWATLHPAIKEKLDMVIPDLKQNLTKKAADAWKSYDDMKQSLVLLLTWLKTQKAHLASIIDYLIRQL